MYIYIYSILWYFELYACQVRRDINVNIKISINVIINVFVKTQKETNIHRLLNQIFLFPSLQFYHGGNDRRESRRITWQ